jgi:nicotinamide riboside kinase
MTAAARLIAIVGAECTGKSTLAHDLATALRQRLPAGERIAVVGEYLREWCEATGRTPLAHEQGAILRRQHERIGAALEAHSFVIADTTALETAAYSQLIFGDSSLRERALTLHARANATLLAALDLPWQPDGHQRDGAHMQAPVDALLRGWLTLARLPFSVVHGQGPARVAQALAAIEPLLATNDAAAGPSGRGLFSGLGAAATASDRTSRWWCECCNPAAEATLRRLATRPSPPPPA